MSNLRFFMKSNKKPLETLEYEAVESIKDDEGNVVKWQIRQLDTKTNNMIRNQCMKEIPIVGKKGMTQTKVDHGKYLDMLIVESVVYPELDSAELQDSYGVTKPEELITEIIDNPNEYNALVDFILTINGFDNDLDEQIEQSKN